MIKMKEEEMQLESSVLTILMDLKAAVGRVEGKLDSRPCMQHQQDIRDLSARIDKTDSRVDVVEKQQVMSIWWATKSGKILAAFIGLLLAVTTGTVTALVLSSVQLNKANAAEVQSTQMIYIPDVISTDDSSPFVPGP